MANKNNNPKNEKSLLFRKLTRLLSGPVAQYKRQTPRRFRKEQAKAAKFRSASGQNFKRDEYSPYKNMTADYMSNQNRAERYIDFDQMEYTPEIASALDIYADEMTASNSIENVLRINCSNEEIKIILDNLYYSILNVEYNLFGWCRSMCKYGDFFLYLDIDDQKGIQYGIGLPPSELERLEGEDKTNPNYIQYQWNAGGITFENWQVAHFRILGNDKYSPYGTSICEPARRIWRQLTLMEDAVMAYRIVRSPERKVFYIDVGSIAANDVEQYMQKVMTQMKRNQIVDPDTGRIDLRYNPLSIEEDYYIPVRGGTNSRIENLPGGTYTGDIEDIKYLRDKLFAALKIPAAYLSRAEGSEEDKTTLAQKDIRFARTVQRLQRSVLSELEKIGLVHLFTLGYRGNDLLSFNLSLNNPSKLAELQELEHWRTKFDVASAATEGFFSRRWVAKSLFNISEEEFVRMRRETFYDKKHDALLEKSVEEITASAETDDFAPPGGGGDLPGLDDLGGGDLAPDAAADTPDAAGAPEEDDDNVLLAQPSPAKRDEIKDVYGRTKLQTTERSKGKKYEPVSYRGSDKRDMGARKRHLKAKYASELASSTKRNTFKGYDSMKSLTKGIVNEASEFLNDDETKLFEVNLDLQKLIKEVESKNEA